MKNLFVLLHVVASLILLCGCGSGTDGNIVNNWGQEPKSVIMIRNTVDDFHKWDNAFQELKDEREEHGLRQLQVYHSNADSNDISVFFEITDPEKAFPYMVSKKNIDAMQGVGITGTKINEFRMLESVPYSHDSVPSNLQSKFCVMVRHKVEDFDHWKEKFESFEKVRRAEDLYVTHVFRDTKDTLDITVVAVPEDLKRARKYGTYLHDDGVWKRAGVMGDPDVQLFELIR